MARTPDSIVSCFVIHFHPQPYSIDLATTYAVQSLHLWPWLSMDTRTGQWNVFYRTSLDGGKHLTPTVRISSFVPGFSYLTQAGFASPYGDYWQMTVDEDNNTQMAFGEAPNYQGPGNIWVSNSN